MANHLHSRLFLKQGDVVEVASDTQANVTLMDDSNYSNYKSGRSYNYYGGFFTHFPAQLAPPRSGYWNVVLDLGGGQAGVRHSIRVVSRD